MILNKSNQTEEMAANSQATHFLTSKRLQVFCISALTIFMNSLLRSSLSINMICMLSSNTTSQGIVQKEFEWSRPQQGYILSSFYYGYLISQLPAGYLSKRFGAKVVLISSIGVGSLATILTTWSVKQPIIVLLFIRIVLGLSMGFIIPSNTSCWGKWAPTTERSALIVFAMSGSGTGVVFTMLTASKICEIPYQNGWPLVNYIYGSIGLITCILIYFLFYNSPDKHPHISETEKQYICQSTGIVNERRIRMPWSGMLRSPAIYAIVTAHIVSNWGYYAMVNLIPSYIGDVFADDVHENGKMSAMPFVAWSVISLVSSPLADFLRNNHILSTKNTRKLFQLTCLISTTFCLTVMTFTSKTTSIVLLIIGVGSLGLAMTGFLCNMVDVAPRHAGVIMSISNTVSTLPGILAPILAGVLTKNGTREEWRKFFFISAGLFIFGSIIFGLFAEGEEQEWDKEKDMKKSTYDNTIILEEQINKLE